MDRDDFPEDERPRLQSLAQAARAQQLKQIRNTLLIIGILTVIVNVFELFTMPAQIRAELAKQDPAMANAPGLPDPETLFLVLGYTCGGFGVLLGALFILFGALVHSYPVPITLASLIVYAVPALACGITDLSAGAVGMTVLRIFCIIALAKAVRTAFAYQREQREAQRAARRELDDEDFDD